MSILVSFHVNFRLFPCQFQSVSMSESLVSLSISQRVSMLISETFNINPSVSMSVSDCFHVHFGLFPCPIQKVSMSVSETFHIYFILFLCQFQRVLLSVSKTFIVSFRAFQCQFRRVSLSISERFNVSIREFPCQSFVDFRITNYIYHICFIRIRAALPRFHYNFNKSIYYILKCLKLLNE